MLNERLCACSTAEKLQEMIPDVAKNLEKSQKELTDVISQENRAANDEVLLLLF